MKSAIAFLGRAALILICIWSLFVVMLYIPEARPYWSPEKFRFKWFTTGGDFAKLMDEPDEYGFSSALDKVYLLKVSLSNKGYGFDRDAAGIEQGDLPLKVKIFEDGKMITPDLFANNSTVSTQITQDEIIRSALFSGKRSVDYAVTFVYDGERDSIMIPEGTRISYSLDESLSDFAFYSAMTIYICTGIFIISLSLLIWIYRARRKANITATVSG